MNNNLPTLAAYQPRNEVNLVKCRLYPEKYPRIGETDHDAAVSRMVPLVWAAILYKGQDASEQRIAYIAECLVDEIMADDKLGLRSLSWEEIGITIRNAVLGVSGEMYGVSVATLYAALAAYAKNEGHQAELKAGDIRRSQK